MKENENDPILFSMPFRYKTGHKEYITVDKDYYDAEDGIHVIHKCSECEYIEDEINFHYSGKVAVADIEGILQKDIPEFQREHKSVKDFIKYIAENDVLQVRKRTDRLRRYDLWSNGDTDISSYCISKTRHDGWNMKKLCIGYKEIKSNWKNVKLQNRIPWIFFMQSFGKWLYNLDKSLDANTVFDIYHKDYNLEHPGLLVDVQPMIDNVDAFEEVYKGYCNYERHKQDKEIADMERQLEELKQKKYSDTVAGFNL